MKTSPHAAQRGAATLAISLLLVFAILMSVAFANRSVLFEAKTSTNQYRAAQAFEAAEAGLEWAIAQLNNNALIGDDCLPSTGTAATPFRERTLAQPLAQPQATCTQSDNGWSCSCPAPGVPPTIADNSSLAFAIQFAAGEQPGLLQLTSVGNSGGTNGSHAQVQALIGRLPGLDALPAAALTVRGTPSFSSAAFSVQHTDPASSGMTVHSGGSVDPMQLRLVSTPGTPTSTSVLGNDVSLAQLTSQGLFASMFRMDKTAWRAQPVVRELDCQSACDTALTQAVGSPVTHPLIWLRGGLRLDTPVLLGTPERPVLLVVDGPVEIHAGAVIHGVIYGTAASWVDAAGSTIHGAVVMEGDLQATGNTQIHHNAAMLQALHDRTGIYARVPGSWRDF